MFTKHILGLFLFLSPWSLLAQDSIRSYDLSMMYKQTGSQILELQVYYPPETKEGDKFPAIIFFFGGGWKGGSMQQFAPHATYFSKRGFVCFVADYRVESRHGTTPIESVKDARSAIRFIKRHSTTFYVDPDQIIASGGSAGGHLAAATAFISTYNEATDDLNLSTTPQALVLFNPVIDNSPEGYGFDRIGAAFKDFSPLHNIGSSPPPTIFFLGTEDNLIPVSTAELFKNKIEEAGGRCELRLYEGQGHGFFNYKNRSIYDQTIREVEEFLIELGFMKPQ